MRSSLINLNVNFILRQMLLLLFYVVCGM